MFSILDSPEHTTLERAREAIRFGGINLDEVVRYLREGNADDRLAQANYYREVIHRAKVRRVCETIALILLGSLGSGLSIYWFFG